MVKTDNAHTRLAAVNLRTWEYFRDGDLKLRFQTACSILGTEPWLALTLPIALLVSIILLLFRPLVLIRVGLLRSDRIGHFAMNHEIFLCEEHLTGGNTRTFDLYFFGSIPTCNSYLACLWSLQLRVWPRFILRPISLVLRSTRCFADHVCGEPQFSAHDTQRTFDRTSPRLVIPESDYELGRVGLEDLGVPRGAAYVCLVVRDSAYLTSLYGSRQSQHDFRDASIEKFNKSALWLVDHGYYVIRMGNLVNEHWTLQHPMVIDYACSEYRSDFLDIFILATCSFCISTCSGLDGIALIFRRPTAFVNAAPLGWLSTYFSNSVLLAKEHYSIRLGRRLTLAEIFASDLAFASNSEAYETRGVQLRENTPEQIQAVTEEMHLRLSGTYPYGRASQQLQELFREEFCSKLSPLQRNLHPEIVAHYSSSQLTLDPEWLCQST
jgi:putative glycosyltransferase (TIGR04372 family)